MLPLPKEFILFDLEYTAWEGSQERNWSGKNEHREIIQIGSIRVAGSNVSESDHLLEYVKPIINPTLSDFIVELTGIKQSDVDSRGILFSKALPRLGKFIGELPAYCWGRDIEVLKENCILNSTELPRFFSQMINLKVTLSPVFESIGVDTKKYSSGTLISALTGAQEPRRAHDALNDMRNLCDALLELRARIA